MDILDKFIENAKLSIQEGYYKDLEKADVERVSLAKKFVDHDFVLITEIKHASPAGEYEFKDIDPKRAAVDFRESGADAISVVVEPKIFKGNLKNIPLAKQAGLPVLFKDFVFRLEQIDAAAAVGADCVLLVVKVADRLGKDLDTLIEYAHEKGLEVLLESYDVDELKKAMQTDADVLGINNRELTTLEVDIGRTERILKAVELDRPLISESGIKNADDVAKVKSVGARGALVGTAIWKADDLKEKIRELRSGAQR